MIVDGRIVGASGGEGQEDGADAAAESAPLHFSSPRDAAMIAAFLRTGATSSPPTSSR
ncbi:hypothetical protein [Streptomyces sp. NPDC001436]